MSSRYFPEIAEWHIPRGAFSDSLREMSRDGFYGNESIVLWLGHRNNHAARVTHLVAPRGPGVIKRPDLLRIDTSLFNEITDAALRLGVTLIGHIHTHGPGYATDLSPTDQEYGLSVPYYLSIVVPGYGLIKRTGITDCGIHVFDPGSGFRRLLPAELKQRIHMQRFRRSPLIVVGGK